MRVDSDNVLKRNIRALSHGSHFFGDTGIGVLDAGGKPRGCAAGLLPVDALFGEQAPVDFDAAMNVVRRLAAILQPGIARGSGDLNEREGRRLLQSGGTHAAPPGPRRLFTSASMSGPIIRPFRGKAGPAS